MWSFIESWGRQAVSSLIFLLLARLLVPEAFGLIALADLFVSFMRLFIDQGFAQAIVQKEEIEPEHLDSAFWISLAFGLSLTAINIPVAYLAAHLYSEPRLIPVITVISLGFIFNALSSVQEAILSRELAFKSLAIRSFVAISISGVLGISLAYYGFGIWSIVTQQLSYIVIGTITLWSASQWRPGLKFSLSHAKELFSFGINIVGFKFVNYFGLRTDDMLIGFFLGPVQLGYYTVAYKILLTMRWVLISVVSRVTLPVFSRLQKEPEKLRKAFYNVTQFSSFFAFPIFIAASVLSPNLIAVFLGEQWSQSIPVMRILLLLGPLQAISYYNSSIILAKGRPDLRLYVQVVNVCVNIIGFIVAVRFGIVAVALSCVIRGYLVSPVSLSVINKLIQIDVKKYLTQYIGPLTSSAIMAAVLYSSEYYLEGVIANQQVLLGLCVVIGFVSYLGAIALFSPHIVKKLWGFTKKAYTALRS